jgi:predicted GIY-YIG superfamily endonuclease
LREGCPPWRRRCVGGRLIDTNYFSSYRSFRAEFLVAPLPILHCCSKKLSDRSGRTIARPLSVSQRFVYILRTVNDPSRRYIGITADLPTRLRSHNAGQNASTAPWKPWGVDICIEFRTEELARRFERYLKSGSGHEFAKRHFE